MNEERRLIRDIFMCDLEEVKPLADQAREKFAITFPSVVVDTLLNIRLFEKEDAEYYVNSSTQIKVDYGQLLSACKQAYSGKGWQLGITTIRESLIMLDSATQKLDLINREIFRRFLWGISD